MSIQDNLQARLEGAVQVVELTDGVTISFRHPTREQIAAAMAKAGVTMGNLRAAQESGQVDIAAMEDTAKMPVAYEYIGAYCVVDVHPRPDLTATGAAFRCRDKYGLRSLSESAMEALDPYIMRLGEYLLEQANISESEGED